MKEYLISTISAYCFPLLYWSNYAQLQRVLAANGAQLPLSPQKCLQKCLCRKVTYLLPLPFTPIPIHFHISNSQSPHALGYERPVALPQDGQFWTNVICSRTSPMCHQRWFYLRSHLCSGPYLSGPYPSKYCILLSFTIFPAIENLLHCCLKPFF